MFKKYNKVFESGETYDRVSGDKSILVMAVDTIDDDEAWLAVMWLDENGNTIEADELCVKSSDYTKWIRREIK